MGFGNFSLVSGAKFSPFSYLELLAPVLMATQAHLQLEDAYSELGTLASIWEGMIDLNLDPELYLLLQAYVKALNNQVDTLARQGLSPVSRREMLNMKQRYAREINPIEVAYKKREEDIARQKKTADATSGAAVFTRDARTTSLKDYMDGVDDYGLANLSELFKEGAAGATAISSRYINTEEGRLFNNMYLDLKTTTGMSDAEVAAFLSNERDNNGNLLFPNLHNLKNEIMAKYNSDSFSLKDQLRMSNAILQGINSGIVYKVDHKPFENYATKLAMEHNFRMQEKAGEEARKADANKKELVRTVKAASLFTKEEKENFSKTQANIDKWIKAGYLKKNPDGTFTLMQKGLNYANETFDTNSRFSGVTTHWKDLAFRDFLIATGSVEDKESGAVKIGSGKYGYRDEYKLRGKNSSKMKLYMDVLERGYDATRSTEFIYNYGTDAEKSRAKDAIMIALGNSGALIYSFKGKDLGYTSDNKTIDKKDFTQNYTVLAHKGSKYGTVFVILDKDGNLFNIRVPEVDRAQQDSANRYYAAAEMSLREMENLRLEIDDLMEKSGNNLDMLSETEKRKVIDYYSHKNAYEESLWLAQQALGKTTRGFTTKNAEIE